MFQRLVAMLAIAIASKFGVAALLVAIGTAFAHAYARTAAILVRRCMVLTVPMAA
jgi:hypothetical protein